MDLNTFPTKGNLILAKNSLALSKQGYELMDKKRNILIRELMELISSARNIQEELDQTFRAAYEALQKANIEMGIHNIEEISRAIPEENTIQIKSRSIMGTEIPLTQYEKREEQVPYYGFSTTKLSLDEACMHFNRVKELTIRLAMIENAAYRLATSIKKTQKRANALKNITIPYYSELTMNISNALEEKEREEFTRLKVIKKNKDRKKIEA